MARKRKLITELNGRTIHPALHYEPGFSTVGIVLDNGRKYDIVTSTGNLYKAKEIQSYLSAPTDPRPEISDRWRLPPQISLADAVELLIHKWRELQWFQNERIYSLCAVWAAGTYAFPAFTTYPYL